MEGIRRPKKILLDLEQEVQEILPRFDMDESVRGRLDSIACSLVDNYRAAIFGIRHKLITRRESMEDDKLVLGYLVKHLRIVSDIAETYNGKASEVLDLFDRAYGDGGASYNILEVKVFFEKAKEESRDGVPSIEFIKNIIRRKFNA